MLQKFKKFLQFIWPAAAFCLILFIFFKTVHAQGYLGEEWYRYLEPELPSFRGEPGATGEELAVNAIRRGIGIIKYLMGAIALLFGIIYAASLVFARGKEEAITKQKTNFLWVFVGFVILMLADAVSDIFNPVKATSEDLINFEKASDQLRDIANYIKWLFGSVVVLLMTISGIRLITAGGDEEKITKEKRHLIWSGIGLLVILLASNIVNAIYVVESPTEIRAAETTIAITEIGGIIRLILVFLGPIAVLFTIYAGFMYLTAFQNEEKLNKAKKMIIAGVTGIIIIYAAFALVNTFMTELPTEALPSP